MNSISKVYSVSFLLQILDIQTFIHLRFKFVHDI